MWKAGAQAPDLQLAATHDLAGPLAARHAKPGPCDVPPAELCAEPLAVLRGQDKSALASLEASIAHGLPA